MRTALLTGATGCVGHHVLDALLATGEWRVRALVRDPARFRWAPPADRVEIVAADMAGLAGGAEAVAEGVDAVVHLATAWGDPIAYPVNVDATLALARLGKPMVYFSTASILDGRNAVLPEAETLGTDYVRSKALAYRAIRAMPAHAHVMTLFPTLIISGEGRHPASHLGRALPDVGRWLRLARWLTLDGTFQFIHAADLARVVVALLAAPRPAADLVMGNAPLTADAALAQLCEIHGVARGRTLDLTPLAPLVAAIAGSRMSSWDRWCLRQRHFAYDAANPRSLGLPPGYETLVEIFRHEGWAPGAGRGGRPCPVA